MKWSSLTPPLLVVLALAGFRASPKSEAPGEPIATSTPHVFVTKQNEPRVVSDWQLQSVLERVRPAVEETNANNLLHALRLWGKEARFTSEFWSGGDLCDYFLDDGAFRRMIGVDAPPLFERVDGRLVARPWQRDDLTQDFASAHANDIVATFAEIGLASDQAIKMRSGEATVQELYKTAAGSFFPEQLEYEWSLISYARWGYPQTQWKNRYGEWVYANDLIFEAMQQPRSFGVCVGAHRLEGLVLINDLSSKTTRPPLFVKSSVNNYLKTTVRLLTESQSPQGFWTRRWHEGPSALTNDRSTLSERILATGHHLEWLAFAPDELQPPRECIVRAAQWLTTAMLEVEGKELRNNYGPFSHGARALCLWRGDEAWPTWQRLLASIPEAPSADRL